MELLLLREQAAASEDLRQDLLRRLDGGAAVELGPLRPEVRVSYERRLTVGTLIPLLGEERVGELKALVERTEVRKLLVHGPA